MLNLNKLVPIRGVMWESIHQMMRLERKDDNYISGEIAWYLSNRDDLDDEERTHLARVAKTMIDEQREECIADGVQTSAEYMKEKRANNENRS